MTPRIPVPPPFETLLPSERCELYVRAVLDGKKPACKYEKLAVERFVRDLKRAKKKDFPYTYIPEIADRAVGFMELMPHVKGRWAAKDELLVFQPWQCFIECNLFGWVHKKTGKRRFRQSYEEIPRKNAKSTRASARGLFMLAADGEAGAEVYSGATSEKQALEVFKPAWMMVNKLPDMRSDLGIEQGGTAKNPGTIYREHDMSQFQTLIGKPGDGASPHCAIIDEYHEHDTDHMVETMQTGMGAREQPLLSIITTAGSNLSGPCHTKRGDCIRILEGTVEDDTIFAIIYGIDEDDQWDDPACLKKANPNYGISVFEDFLLAQLKEAKRSATKQNAFRTKHLNQWVGARTLYMNMLAWQRQKKPDLTIESCKGMRCWMAGDLATKKDVAALILLFEDSAMNYYTIPKFYVPEGALETNEKYREFHTGGHLIATPGDATDFEYIEEDIKALVPQVKLEDMCFDDWQANYLITRLMKLKLNVVNFNQTVKNMSEPMKQVEADVLSRRLWHDGNPVMTWMWSNVSARMDAKENVYPRKEREDDPHCKIDGPVAMIMARGRAMAAPPPREKFQFFTVG
jgi:phage terminase large subunit-like protein